MCVLECIDKCTAEIGDATEKSRGNDFRFDFAEPALDRFEL